MNEPTLDQRYAEFIDDARRMFVEANALEIAELASQGKILAVPASVTKPVISNKTETTKFRIVYNQRGRIVKYRGCDRSMDHIDYEQEYSSTKKKLEIRTSSILWIILNVLYGIILVLYTLVLFSIP